MENTSILIYLLKSTVAFTALYGLYLLAFRQNQQFVISRYYLVFTIVFASLFPLIKFISYKTVVIPYPETVIPEIAGVGQNLSTNQPAISFWNSSSMNNIIFYLYLIVGSLMLVRLLYMLIRFGVKLLKKSRIERLCGKKVIVSDYWNQTFSFFGFIVLPQKDFQLKENQLLIQHELVHVRQYHTLDLLLAELFQVLHWFNPLAYFIKKDMREIHEFLADLNVVKGGTCKYAYQQLLLNYLSNSVTPRIANSFSAKLLKKRFAMMTTNKTPKSVLVKYTLAIPVIAVLIGLMSFQTKVNYVSAPLNENEVNTTDYQVDFINNVENTNNQTTFQQTQKSKDQLKKLNTSNIQKEKTVEVQTTVVSTSRNTGEDKEDQKKLLTRLKTVVTNNKGTYLKDFILNSDNIPLILKQGVTYRFYLVWSENHNNLENNIVLSVENKEKVTEEIKPIKVYKGKDHSYFDYFCKRTGAYKLGITDYVAEIKYAAGLCLLSIDESYTIKTETTNNSPAKQDTSKNIDDVFVVVEEMPKFDNKDVDAAKEYIAKNVKYPEAAAKEGIQGRVYVSFIVEKDGAVSTVKIVRSANPLLDKEAASVVETMPKWTPGYQGGKAVRVQIILPIIFNLDDKK